MQLAEEVMKSGPVVGEPGSVGETGAAFEGMEALAKAIETGTYELLDVRKSKQDSKTNEMSDYMYFNCSRRVQTARIFVVGSSPA